MKHVEWVNLDQINIIGMEGVDIQWKTTKFWKEIPCMEVVNLMSGAQGEEAHQAYKEGNGNHGKHVLIIILIMDCYDLFLSLVV